MVKKIQHDLFESHLHGVKPQLTDQQKLSWLRLIRSPNIGPITFRELINHFGSAENAIHNIENGRLNGRARKLISPSEVELELEQANRYGSRLVALGETGYPHWLTTIDDAPPLIYIKGDAQLAEKNSIAIVGSRNASAAGRKLASILAKDLSTHGFVIVSGLAQGIDTEVHQASLGEGTIAVLGGGIDHIYPSSNEGLYQKIASDGLLVSERPMGYYAKAKDFPRRNRLISGISVATIVVEAAKRSGSLITARFAAEQGREVYAIPGNPLDPRAYGTNKLIQDGAMLVTSARDIIDTLSTHQNYTPSLQEEETEFNIDSHSSPEIMHEKNDSLRQAILELLGPTPMERDELSRRAKCSSRQLQIILLDLDLEGRIEHHGNQLISLKPV